MSFSEFLTVAIAIFVFGICLLAYDNWNYPLCRGCGSNKNTYREKKVARCVFHGKLQRDGTPAKVDPRTPVL